MSAFIINTELKLKDKQELIQKLVGINIANDIVKRNKKGGNLSVNPIDLNYGQLKCTMTTL